MRKPVKRAVLCCLLLLVGISFVNAQQSGSSEPQIVFRFVSGNDMFYVPWSDNGAKLDSLCSLLVPDILKAGSVRVDGYGNDKKTVKIRCNRVKSELILRRGLTEEHFTTTNRIGTFGELRNVVVVTLPILEEREKPEVVTLEPGKTERPVTETKQEEPKEETPATDVQATTQDVQGPVQPEEPAESAHCRWSIGLNAGIPFFWGDMLSMSADKIYIGFAAGVQGSYRFSDLLAVSLSVDYARGKLGARDYARDYLLAPDGMTWYVPQGQAMQHYGDLYSKVSLVNAGLSLDVNINRIFSKRAAEHRFTVWVSPTVYGQFFSADIYTKEGDKRYSNGTTEPDKFSLGLGGALSLRYRVTRGIDLQLKNSLIWMTDNYFDAIRTPFGKTRHNAMWMPQIGVVWNIK
ncbi:MAG: hypothetical protein PUD07_02910 [bacterium]|nr:hypothetical protein [bacterium]